MKASPTAEALARDLPDLAATERLGQSLAAIARPGDVLLLSGDLGSGKTTLARAIVRALAEDPAMEVPSPTFTLVQSYDAPRLTVHHVDLYRLEAGAELDELGLDDAAAQGLVLVEWPERAPGRFAGDRLEVDLSLDPAGTEARRVRLTGHGEWAARLGRLSEIERFLDAAGLGTHARHHLAGDASTRRYLRLDASTRKAVLMDAPRSPDPGTSGGPAYSRIAHLAEDVVPYVALARHLKRRGVSVPEIVAADLDAGLVALEDLEDDGLLDAAGRPIPERYEAAIDLLVALHGEAAPAELEAAPGRVHRLPRYDRGAFMIEAALLLDWFASRALGRAVREEAAAAFNAAWDEVLAPFLDPGRHRALVLRDFHSPNLLWLPERDGPARVGVIDFQDAVVGPAAYDVASLAMDARIAMPEALSDALIARYSSGRGPGFDADAFAGEVAVMAAQRNTKILGIFARLAERDGKPRYLAHIPQVSAYLDRALAHPALVAVREWFETHLPADLRRQAGAS